MSGKAVKKERKFIRNIIPEHQCYFTGLTMFYNAMLDMKETAKKISKVRPETLTSDQAALEAAGLKEISKILDFIKETFKC